jgi:hypothetical protein
MVEAFVRAQRYWFWGILFAFGPQLWAQETTLSNTRTQLIMPVDTVQLLDSLTILPYTLTITDAKTGQAIDTTTYQLDQNRLTWYQLPADSVTLQYRVLPFNLRKRYRHLDTARLRQESTDALIGFNYNPYEQTPKNDRFSRPQLQW